MITSDQVGAARDLVAPVYPEFIFPCGEVDVLAGLLRNELSDRQRLMARRASVFAHIRTWSPERNIASTIAAVERALSRKRIR